MKSLVGKIPHVTTLLTTASFVEATKVTFRSLGRGKIHSFSPFIVYFVFVLFGKEIVSKSHALYWKLGTVGILQSKVPL